MNECLERKLNDDVPTGYLLVGAMRAALFSLKRGALTGFIRKRAFLQISSMAVKVKPTAGSSSNKTVAASATWKHYSTDMVKNTILGMAVFGTYELVAFDQSYILQNQNSPSRKQPPAESAAVSTNQTSIPIDSVSSLRSIAAGSTSVLVHAGAGACAGVAHSFVIAIWEIVLKKQRHPLQLRRLHITQHIFGYASLFGTYEGMRRLLEFGFYDLLSKQEAKVMDFLQLHPLGWMKGEDGVYDITPLRWVMCVMAGGVAGQAHLAVSHAMANSKTLDWRKILMVPRYSTWPSFWMTGLCFVAFEFGGEMTERYVKVEKLQQEKQRKLEERRMKLQS